ncbi:MAG: hypothetical protein HYT11_01515 [Candidatus Levybacteria bacterium]|nr:hypothetical protein [Candidatus Levybacteria bacterium]
MTRAERGFTPLPEVESEKVRFAIKLPDYIDPNEVGVNVSGIETLCRIGAIKHLGVEGSYNQQARIANVAVMGTSNSGAAYMGGIASAESSLHKEFGEEIDPAYVPYLGRWTSGKITIDMQGVANKLNENNRWERGVRSTTGWTHHLNKAVKEGIANIGTGHLVYGLTKTELAFCVIMNTWSLLGQADADPIFKGIAGTYNPHVPSPYEAMYTVISTSVLMTLVYRYLTFRDRLSEDGVHWSLVYGPQIGRALLLQATARTKRLVKPLQNKIQP